MNTKTFMITGLLFFSIGSAFSQAFDESKDQIRIETGYAFTGSGDLEGFCYYNEYSRSVGNKFRIAPAIGFLDFFRNDTEIQFLEDARGPWVLRDLRFPHCSDLDFKQVICKIGDLQ